MPTKIRVGDVLVTSKLCMNPGTKRPTAGWISSEKKSPGGSAHFAGVTGCPNGCRSVVYDTEANKAALAVLRTGKTATGIDSWDWEHSLEVSIGCQLGAAKVLAGDVYKGISWNVCVRELKHAKGGLFLHFATDKNIWEERTASETSWLMNTSGFVRHDRGSWPAEMPPLDQKWLAELPSPVSGSSAPLFPVISLRESHAKPKNPKVPCCGWCGEPLVTIYDPKKGIVVGCSVHGTEAPIVLDPKATKKP